VCVCVIGYDWNLGRVRGVAEKGSACYLERTSTRTEAAGAADRAGFQTTMPRSVQHY